MTYLALDASMLSVCVNLEITNLLRFTTYAVLRMCGFCCCCLLIFLFVWGFLSFFFFDTRMSP